MEPTLLMASAAGPLMGWLVLRRQDRSTSTHRWEIFLAAMLVGLATGRVAAMLTAGVAPWLHPTDLLIVRGGISTGWASIGSLAVVAVHAFRAGSTRLADALAPAAVAALAAWHGACVLRSACLGTITTLPIGWADRGTSAARHPVELYAAAFLVGLFMLVVVIEGRRLAPLTVAGAALAGSSAVRLMTEPLRVSIGGGPVGWYVAGIVAGLALIVSARAISEVSS